MKLGLSKISLLLTGIGFIVDLVKDSVEEKKLQKEIKKAAEEAVKNLK